MFKNGQQHHIIGCVYMKYRECVFFGGTIRQITNAATIRTTGGFHSTPMLEWNPDRVEGRGRARGDGVDGAPARFVVS